MNLPKPKNARFRPKSKYNAVSSHCAAGHHHPSKGEATRCDTLHLLQKAREIKDLEVHPTVQLVEGFKYKPDFSYYEKSKLIYEDWKGITTDRFRIITKLWPFHGTGTLRITGEKRATRDIQGPNKPDLAALKK